MFGYSTTLRSLSQGRATYSMEFKHYSEAPKIVADRGHPFESEVDSSRAFFARPATQASGAP